MGVVQLSLRCARFGDSEVFFKHQRSLRCAGDLFRTLTEWRVCRSVEAKQRFNQGFETGAGDFPYGVRDDVLIKLKRMNFLDQTFPLHSTGECVNGYYCS